MSGETNFMKILNSCFYKVQGITKHRWNLDLFAAHHKKQLKTTASYTDLRKFMTLKLDRQLKLNG